MDGEGVKGRRLMNCVRNKNILSLSRDDAHVENVLASEGATGIAVSKDTVLLIHDEVGKG